MNEGDVFVIDNKKFIFVWVGRSANNQEKLYGAKVCTRVIFPMIGNLTLIFFLQLAQTLKSEHGEANSVIVIVEDRQELALPDDERNAFDTLLPIASKKVILLSEILIN